MKAYEVMNSSPLFLLSWQTVAEASRILLEHNIDAVPVLSENHKFFGLVSKDQLVEVLAKEQSATLTLEKVTANKVRSVSYDDEVSDILKREFDYLAVLKDGQVVGVLEYRKVVKEFAWKEQQKREELEAAINVMPVPIVVMDKYDKIICLNQSAEEVFSIDTPNICGNSIYDICSEHYILDKLFSSSNPSFDRLDINNKFFFPYQVDFKKDKVTVGKVLILRNLEEFDKIVRDYNYAKRWLEGVFQYSYDGVYITDGQANTIRLNQGFERIMGITEEECIGRNMAELVSAGVVSDSGTLRAIKQRETVSVTLVARTGKEALVTSTPIFDEDGNIFLVVTNVRDITELNELERKLKHIEGLRKREMEAVLESFYDGVYITDGQANTLRINQGFERIMGVTEEECKGRNMAELVQEGVFSRSGTLLALEKKETATITLTSNAGKEALVTSTPIFDEDGNIFLVVTNVRDITELNELERKLKQVEGLREREMEAVIESSFDGLYITDGQANTLRLNKGFERIMGIWHKDCVGRNMADLVQEGVFSRSGTLLALEKKEAVTITLVASTGKEALVTSTPIFDEAGNIIMVVTNVRDITELNQLQRKLEHIEGLSNLYQAELKQLKLQSSRRMVITSSKMKELLNMVMRITAVESTVLIQGESGVGKDLIAEIIHSSSNRKDGPFIKVNCGAIPENLLESELFGYEAGAFTGASKTGKVGLFELAKGGILFLDEIGEMPLNLQVKLLRALQDKEIVRVGGGQPLKVDIRILAGTNRDLMEMVNRNQFRLDLYYRLNVIPIYVPPLRERREDIPVLANYFLGIFNEKYQMKKHLHKEVIDKLYDYSWPGNVRELENLIERLVVTSIDDIINGNDLPVSFNLHEEAYGENELMPLRRAIENTERRLLENAFSRYQSSYQVAKVLEVNQSTVVRKAAKYGIKRS